MVQSHVSYRWTTSQYRSRGRDELLIIVGDSENEQDRAPAGPIGPLPSHERMVRSTLNAHSIERAVYEEHANHEEHRRQPERQSGTGAEVDAQLDRQ